MSRLIRASGAAFLSLAALLGHAPLDAAERSTARVSLQAAASTVTARVIVKYRSGASVLSSRALAASVSSSGVQVADALGARVGLTLRNGRSIDGRTQAVRASGMDSATLASRLAADSDVEWAVPDQRRFALAAPNDPLYAASTSGRSPAAGQWYLRPNSGEVASSIDIESAWAYTKGSSSVVVAVLDTGVRTNHTDLVGRFVQGRDFISDVAVANDGNARDTSPLDPGDWVTAAEDATAGGDFEGCGESNSSWHGTQVSGLVGASTGNGKGMAGVAPGVSLMAVRVLGKCGGYDSDIIAAMRWAAGLSVSGEPANANPARVINLSLGSSGSCSSAYRSVVSELTSAGVVVVAAAGNDGSAVGSPANCSGVIAVGGVRHTGTKVGFSNYGSAVTLSAPAGNCVNETGECLYPILSTSNTGTTSPASNTYTTGGDDAALGTSFSTPLVSGVVGLMLSVNPDLTPATVKSLLRSSARSFPSTGADAGVSTCSAANEGSECYCTTSTCGAGLLDAGAAVAAAGGAALTPAITYSPSAAEVGDSIKLSGQTSEVPDGASIASYAWSIVSGSSVASFSTGQSSSTAKLTALAAGTVTVRLTLTDSAGRSASVDQAITVTATTDSGSGSGSSSSSSGGGGGAWSLAWALGLCVACLLLPGRRRSLS